MRIITGTAKGLKLKTPKGFLTRPTSDRIKESIFNVLNNLIEFENLNVLDIFSGTGALGLEALSRGAIHCTFIDKSTASIIKDNVNRAKFNDCAEIINDDVFKHLNKNYDLIFCDPPYNMNLWQKSLKIIDEKNILSSNGYLIVEHGFDEKFSDELKNLEVVRKINYGKTTAIEIFQRKAAD